MHIEGVSGVGSGGAEEVPEYSCRLHERNLVLPQVPGGFAGIPLEFHTYIVSEISSAPQESLQSPGPRVILSADYLSEEGQC
jgi:hypothetical protein